MDRRFQQVDTETGEVVDGYVAVLMPKRRNAFGQDWHAMAQSAWDMIATADLSGADFRVMAALMARLDFENLIQVQQVEIAEHLGMQKQNVGRSIKRLVEMGILLEGPKIGRSRSFRLNPNFGWKGSAKGHHRAIQERMKQAGLSVVKGRGQQEGDAHLQQDAFEGA